jgi:hypothetical protein
MCPSEKRMDLPKGVYMSDGNVVVGFDKERGGAVSWLSKKGVPNVVNAWDCGRLIQQSFYGDQDGSTWNGRPWTWNPVQGGSWDNKRGLLKSLKIDADSNTAVIETTPRNWGGGALCNDVHMKTTVTIVEGGIRVEAEMAYSGDKTHKARHQEQPACFFDPKYSQFVYTSKVTGSETIFTPEAPTDGKSNLVRDAVPGKVGYRDPNGKRTIWVENPGATLVTAYRVSKASNPPASNCSYVSPLVVDSVGAKSTKKYGYTIRIREN